MNQEDTDRTGYKSSPQLDADIRQQLVLLLDSIRRLLDSPMGTAARFGVTEVKLSLSLGGKDALRLMLNPSRGTYAVITSVMVQKATAAASIVTQNQVATCADALAALGGDLTSAAVLGPETAGLASLIPLAFAALDAWNVGTACFIAPEGTASHAIRVSN